MMTRTLAAALIAAPLSLAGCNQSGGVTLDQIKNAAILICGFEPTAIQVASLVPAAQPYAGTADAIGRALCNAVAVTMQKNSIRRRAGRDIVVPITLPNGAVVNVTGHFVK